MTIEEARNFAESWIAAWNAHDMEAILAHYDDAASSSSRVAARLLGNPEVTGKAGLRDYFQRGLAAHPDLARISHQQQGAGRRPGSKAQTGG